MDSKNPLLIPNDRLSKAKNLCIKCGRFHATQEHWEFMQTMPEDPIDLIDDLTKMGLYKEDNFKIADAINSAELRKELFLKMSSRGNPQTEKLIRELAEQAGGLDNAFAAAFGPKAGQFFGDAIANGGFSRRKFLQNLAVGAALVTVVNACGTNTSDTTDSVTTETPVDVGNLEKTDLQVGFIPITCATPIIMSEPLGFYEKYGLNAKVVKMPS